MQRIEHGGNRCPVRLTGTRHNHNAVHRRRHLKRFREPKQRGGVEECQVEIKRRIFNEGGQTLPHQIRRPAIWRSCGQNIELQVWPRTIADLFSALHRAGYRVDVLLEPEVLRSADPGPTVPTSVLWRARKEGQ